MTSRWLAACALVFACGDNLPAPAPDAPPRPHGSLAFTPCSGAPQFDCATLVVPADYADPGGATISLPVVRAPARDPSRRIGVLTFNFGGPGAATLAPIANSYPTQPIGSSIDLTQVFDFVLMDWRGVATTTPQITCLDATTGAELAAQRFAPGSDGAWAQLFQLVAAVDAGCAANGSNAPLLAHQDTESAARDLDALRAGLGEDKLNYWGVSYGTRLGAMYAVLFPEHARAIAIDSPVDPHPQLQAFLQGQSESFEAQLGRFFAWCAAADAVSCPFGAGSGSGGDVAAAFEGLLAAADAHPVVSLGVTIDRPTIDEVATNLMYFPVYQWPELGRALAQLGAGSGSAIARIVTNDQLDYANDDNAFATYQNVCSQDMPVPAAIDSPAAYQAWVETQAQLAPHVGVQNAAAQAFIVGWPSTVPAQQAIGATSAPPLLITATRHDPATPYAGALALQAAFANGSYLVTYEGDGHANGQFEPCLGDAIAKFLIDPTTAPAQTDCPNVVISADVAHPTPYRAGKPSRLLR